jgi:L-ascorbate metabolism protein UlaG (beta-lactamase superfamily)
LWTAASSPVPPPQLEWLGHSGFVVRWQGVTLLLDPNTSDWCTVARRRLRPAPDLSSIGSIDAVLISHAHFDHLDLPTLRSLPRPGAIVLPYGSERYLPDAQAAVPLREGDAVRFGAVEVIAVAAAHHGNRYHPLGSRLSALGYVLRVEDAAVYFAGDTGFANDFEAIGRRFHPRLAILPIGAWAPRVPMRWFHLSPEEAVEAARRLGANTVVPCHFGTFTLALDRPDRALQRFARAAKERGVRWTLAPLYGDRSAILVESPG